MNPYQERAAQQDREIELAKLAELKKASQEANKAYAIALREFKKGKKE